jgi:hypothetical protein
MVQSADFNIDLLFFKIHEISILLDSRYKNKYILLNLFENI